MINSHIAQTHCTFTAYRPSELTHIARRRLRTTKTTELQTKRLFEYYGYELAISKHASCGVDGLRVGADGLRCGVYADCVMTLADGAVVFAGCMVGRGLSNHDLRMAGRRVLLARRCVVLAGCTMVLFAAWCRCRDADWVAMSRCW